MAIIMIHYSGSVVKALAIMEMAGAIGSAGGPFLGSTLNNLFGYEGPFLTFAIVFVIGFFLLAKYIPSDKVLDEKIEAT